MGEIFPLWVKPSSCRSDTMTKYCLMIGTEVLNVDQQGAVDHTGGVAYISAGPGAGKTRVIVERIAKMCTKYKSIRQDSIYAVALTNKAAGEIRDRISDRIGRHGVNVTTFHSMCLRWLRDYIGDIDVADSSDARGIIQDIVREIIPGAAKGAANEFMTRISAAKNAGQTLGDYKASEAPDRLMVEVWSRYENEKDLSGLRDFDDLLLDVAIALSDDTDFLEEKRREVQHLMVDEAQDSNLVQLRIIERLFPVGEDVYPRSLVMIGDLDQSIYGFRGAEPDAVTSLIDSYSPTVHNLGTNYRSTQAIVSAGAQLIASVPNPYRVSLRASEDAEAGLKPRVFRCGTHEDLAPHFTSLIDERPDDTHMIVYRTGATSRAYETSLMNAGIPYRLSGGQPFWARAEVKDLTSWVSLALNPQSTVALKRVLGTLPYRIGAVIIDSIKKESNGEGLVETMKSTKTSGKRGDMIRMAGEDIGRTIAELMGEDRAAAVDTIVSHVSSSWKDDEEGSRAENLAEAAGAVKAASDLREFMENVTLNQQTDKSEAKVTLTTVHAAKGTESDHVYIAGFNEGLFPHSRSSSESEICEEQRLAYVAVTRARKTLEVGVPSWQWGRELMPSRWLPLIADESAPMELMSSSEEDPWSTS